MMRAAKESSVERTGTRCCVCDSFLASAMFVSRYELLEASNLHAWGGNVNEWPLVSSHRWTPGRRHGETAVRREAKSPLRGGCAGGRTQCRVKMMNPSSSRKNDAHICCCMCCGRSVFWHSEARDLGI